MLVLACPPGGFDRLVVERPRCLQIRFGGSHRCLDGGALGKCARRRDALLRLGKLDEIVDRGASVAHCRRGDTGSEEPERWEPVQGAVDHRTVEYRGDACVRDEQVFGHRVMTAGTTQTERVPGIEDFELLGGQREHAGRSSSTQPANSTLAWVMPLQNAQRPDTTTPSGTRLALPCGAHTPAATPRPAPNSSARLAGGRYAMSRLLVIAIETHQPADASPRAISSAQRNATPGGRLQTLDLHRRAPAQQTRLQQLID